ncbi:unnamed protein product [Rhizoctonia solani]|uniref:Cation/H+ exchanger transmembrane domain-containing protein n=1 Tax=Rhizoctonia solani TaxID=456999 RepID=A0A8H3DGA1_9AGAM|nr:unnamed protein product [Rhizoctonia solani]
MSMVASDCVRISLSRLVDQATKQQGGLLTNSHPTDCTVHNPIRLFIIQLVLGGIILGPTALGRIPGFTEYVFPEPSRPYLALVANIGLILFLFLIGLEIDPAVIKRNVKTSITVSVGGMILPFGIGAAVAVPIYNNFIDPEAASFNHFLLFVGVAFSITAFPMLCRTLVALELLDTTVGVVVLSAGVCNDVVGWTLLALTVALVNASTGLTALFVFVYAVGWTLFIIYPAKRSMIWLARRTGSVENGPSPLFMTTTILLVFGSALLTDIIGVHAIFGGFLAGLAIPHEGGLAIALTEKLEDIVSIIFLPLYFTLSGMSTDLGLLNNSITWGHTVLICVTAYVGKFSGGTLAAKFAGFNTRESATIGTLMSCKGLVELIVLNVGLSAGILSTQVFSMFVLEALVLTFATTPVTLWLYPLKYRVRASAVGDDFSHASDDETSRSRSSPCDDDLLGLTGRRRFLFVFDKFESLPSAMMISRLLQVTPRSTESRPELAESELVDLRIPELSEFAQLPVQEPPPRRHSVNMDALRLLELTERTSAVMRSSEVDQLLMHDPLLTVFKTFAELEDIPVTGSLSIVSPENFVPSIMEHSIQNGDEMVVVSWTPTIGPGQDVHNPFGALFKNSGTENTSSGIRSPFLRQLFSQSSVDVALFIERGTGATQNLGGRGGAQHLFLPFFGGPDDRLALSFVVQLCKHPLVSATVVRVRNVEDMDMDTAVPGLSGTSRDTNPLVENDQVATVHSISGLSDIVYAPTDTQARLASDTHDDMMWSRCSTEPSSIKFKTIATPTPIRSIVALAQTLGSKCRLISVVGRGKQFAPESHREEMKKFGGGGEVRKTAGDVAAALFLHGAKGPVVVLQAAYASRREE